MGLGCNCGTAMRGLPSFGVRRRGSGMGITVQCPGGPIDVGLYEYLTTSFQETCGSRAMQAANPSQVVQALIAAGGDPNTIAQYFAPSGASSAPDSSGTDWVTLGLLAAVGIGLLFIVQR